MPMIGVWYPTQTDPVQKDLSTILEKVFDLDIFDEEELDRLIESVEDPALSVRSQELKQLRDLYIQHGDLEGSIKELREIFAKWQVEVDLMDDMAAFSPLNRQDLRLVCYQVLS